MTCWFRSVELVSIWLPRVKNEPWIDRFWRKLPLVFLHGTGQFSKTWETTPDGREGFQTIFLRRRFPVYLIDQRRRGNAGCQVPAGR
jgi:pimeloyl-ACP methyl ester carboxylesterase